MSQPVDQASGPRMPAADPEPARFVPRAAWPVRDGLLHVRLRLSDRPLVAVGQPVEPGQPIVQRFREQEEVDLPTTAAIVGMRPGDALANVPVARSRRRSRRAPQETLAARIVEHGRDGITRLVAGTGDTTVHAPAAGFVEALLPGRLDIRVHGLSMSGKVGWGRPAAGRLVIAAESPDGEVPTARIDVNAAGAVLVVGARMDVEAMSRARAIGVAAVISGGVASRDLRQLSESELRQQASLHATSPFGLVALGGYGRLPIPRHLWDMLVAAAAEGRSAGILPETRTLVVGGDAAPLDAAARRPDGTVRVVAGPGRDREGRLVGLAGQRRWPGGGYGPGGFVELEAPDGSVERTCLPLALLERLD